MKSVDRLAQRFLFASKSRWICQSCRLQNEKRQLHNIGVWRPTTRSSQAKTRSHRQLKTISKVKYVPPEAEPIKDAIDDLPTSTAVDSNVDSEKWPELAREVLANQKRFPHCVLLTKVGNFYEVRTKATTRKTIAKYRPTLIKPSKSQAFLISSSQRRKWRAAVFQWQGSL